MSSHINPDSGTLVVESTNALDVTASPVDPVGAALHVKGGTYTEYNLGSNGNPWNKAYLQKIVITTTSVTNSSTLNTTGLVYINSSTSLALALANGTEGEKKSLVVTTSLPSTVVITPDTFVNGTSVSFTTIGQSIELIYTSAGWAITSSFGNPSVS
jgi:hypothetical protein